MIEVYDHNSPEVCHLKDQIEPLMSEGIEFLKGGHLDIAMLNFKKAQVIFPQDLPLRLLITSIQNVLEHGQAIQGTAILDFRSK